MTVEYWLIGGKTKLRLPVPPEMNEFSSPFSYDDYEVEGLGEVTTLKRRGLREFKISSFWPRDYNPTYCAYSAFISPQKFYNQIENWRNARVPIRYVVTGAVALNIKVTIRDFNAQSDMFGSPGDLYYTMTIKEFRDVTIQLSNTAKKPKKPGSGGSRPPAAPPAKAKTYTVKKNDSLWKIAALKTIYGKGSEWPKIYKANKKIIGPNSNKLKVGMKLVIPR